MQQQKENKRTLIMKGRENGFLYFSKTEEKIELYEILEGGIRKDCPMSDTELKILALLISHPGKTFRKREIIEYAWAGRVVTIGSLTQAIFNLRSELKDETLEIIITEPRKGYSISPIHLRTETPDSEPSKEYINESKTPKINENTAIPKEEKPRQSILKKIATPRFLHLIGALCTLVAASYSTNHIKHLWKIEPPLQLKEIKSNNLIIKFINQNNERLTETLKRQAENLKIEPEANGEIWVIPHRTRYRVICFYKRGGNSVSAPYSFSLEKTISICKANYSEHVQP